VASVVATPSRVVASTAASRWKQEFRDGCDRLHAAFERQPQPSQLLVRQSRLVDRVVRGLWAEVGAPSGIALVAVGGYGRGQLFPHSDVDILILLPRPAADTPAAGAVEQFIGLLWDAGLETAHSVRTIAECETEMAGDITIRTSLLEHRLITGSRSLFDRFRRRFAETLDIRVFY
jgi:[protein-PII] uridylyltransferase